MPDDMPPDPTAADAGLAKMADMLTQISEVATGQFKLLTAAGWTTEVAEAHAASLLTDLTNLQMALWTKELLS